MHRNTVSIKLFFLAAISLFIILPQAAISNAAEPIILQLRWDHQFQFAGYYAAKWQGYYDEVGLDVDIRSAVLSDSKILKAVDEVASGRADFGIGASDILVARDNGKPLVVSAVIFQKSAAMFYAKASTKLNSPRDLVQLRVARNLNDLIDVELQAMLRAEGIDPTRVKAYPHKSGNQHLLSGAVDVVPGYSISAPFNLQEDGIPISEMYPSSYGIDFYGDALFTSERLIKKKPELVTKFTAASIKGWQYALENSEKIALRISEELPRRAPVKDFLKFNRFQIAGVKKLTHSPIVTLGHINPKRWERMHSSMKQSGLITGNLELSNFIFDPIQLEKDRKNISQRILWVTTALLFLFCLTTLLFVFVLRRAVAKKTRDLSRSEEKFKALADSSPLAIYMATGDEQRAEYINPTFIKLFGYTIEDVPTVNHWGIVAYPDTDYRNKTRAEWQKRIKDARETNADMEPLEVIVTCKDGIKKNISWRFSAIEKQHWALGLDLTEHYQAEKEKEILESHLRQAHKMEAIGTMAGGIAHDFNNLLAIIQGNIDAIHRRRNVGKDFDKNIELISSSTKRAIDLVSQILAFSRQKKTSFIPTNLTMTVQESLKLLRSTTPSTIEVISTFTKENIPIKADTTQMQQVLLNLCTNAVHAMNDKGLLSIHLSALHLSAREISTTAEQKAGKYAKLTITDTGIGMDKNTMARIFEPFFTTKEVGAGTGMGLSMVYGIINSHDGFITVESTLDFGTSFNIYLPIIDDENSEQGPSTVQPLPSGTEKIMYVDDETYVSSTYTELLEYQGYKVTSITSSIEALALFKQNPTEFDLIFTDQTMPNMTGTELATEMLSIRPDIPIILCSGFNATTSKEEIKKIGIREFCMKPMEISLLTQITRRVLDEGKNLE
jgi:PAS domain S-box-containing protein